MTGRGKMANYTKRAKVLINQTYGKGRRDRRSINSSHLHSHEYISYPEGRAFIRNVGRNLLPDMV